MRKTMRNAFARPGHPNVTQSNTSGVTDSEGEEIELFPSQCGFSRVSAAAFTDRFYFSESLMGAANLTHHESPLRSTEACTGIFPFIRTLDSIARDDFQAFCENKMSKDWKTWSGNCHGYEGLD